QDEAPPLHVCNDCAKGKYSGKCTDSTLVSLSSTALQATCLWRRTLLACSDLNRILPTNLARCLKVEMSIAQGLVKRLEKEGFVRSTSRGKRFGKVVNKTKLLSEGFHKYFSRKPSSELDSNIDKSEKAVHEKNYELEVNSLARVDNKKQNPKGSKRAISLKEEATEFEISHSQECDQDDLHMSKRRKASIARSPILV
ncbi:hypothetical protein P5673_006333, partial [Acropora cervicornis]